MRRSLSYYMGRVRRALSLHIKATRGFYTGSIAMDTPWRPGGARLQPAAQHVAVDLARALLGVAAELDAVPLEHLHAEGREHRLWGGGATWFMLAWGLV